MKLIRIISFILLPFVWSCGNGGKTLVIDQPPSFPGNEQSVSKFYNQTFDKWSVTIGELGRFQTLDPLLIENDGELRVAHLIYQRLVGLDEKNQIQPSLAKRWEVNKDSTIYAFYLRGDAFFHDNDVFLNGKGRRITSKDIVQVFERMTYASVPPRTASRFWSIRGFDASFFHYRLQSEQGLEGEQKITGIQAPNDSMIVFTLDYSDPEFLLNLAHPSASIYPMEAVQPTLTTKRTFLPVGSGAFIWNGVFGDSIVVLSEKASIQHRVQFLFTENQEVLKRLFLEKQISVLPFFPEQFELNSTTSKRIRSSLKESYSLYFNLDNRLGITIEQLKAWLKAKEIPSKLASLPVISSVQPESISSSFNYEPLPLTISVGKNALDVRISKVLAEAAGIKERVRILRTDAISRTVVLIIRPTEYQFPRRITQPTSLLTLEIEPFHFIHPIEPYDITFGNYSWNFTLTPKHSPS